MKKTIYTTITAVILLGFIGSSCHKENLQTSKTAKEQSAGGQAAIAASSSGNPAPSDNNPVDAAHENCHLTDCHK
jgi:hypothetical protein